MGKIIEQIQKQNSFLHECFARRDMQTVITLTQKALEVFCGNNIPMPNGKDAVVRYMAWGNDTADLKNYCLRYADNIDELAQTAVTNDKKYFATAACKNRAKTLSREYKFSVMDLIVDIDYHKSKNASEQAMAATEYFCILAKQNRLFGANAVMFTGRGVQIHWFLAFTYYPKWESILKKIVKELVKRIRKIIRKMPADVKRYAEMDKAASENIGGFARMPYSYNEVAQCFAIPFVIDDKRRTVNELMETMGFELGHDVPGYWDKKEEVISSQKKHSFTNPNGYTWMALTCMQTAQEKVFSVPVGNRDNFLFAYGAMCIISGMTDEDTRAAMEQLNGDFQTPLKASCMNSTIRSVIKHRYAMSKEKFFAYIGEKSDTYNDTMNFAHTKKGQRDFATLISRCCRFASIRQCREQGMSKAAAAKVIGCNRDTVRKYWGQEEVSLNHYVEDFIKRKGLVKKAASCFKKFCLNAKNYMGKTVDTILDALMEMIRKTMYKKKREKVSQKPKMKNGHETYYGIPVYESDNSNKFDIFGAPINWRQNVLSDMKAAGKEVDADTLSLTTTLDDEIQRNVIRQQKREQAKAKREADRKRKKSGSAMESAMDVLDTHTYQHFYNLGVAGRYSTEYIYENYGTVIFEAYCEGLEWGQHNRLGEVMNAPDTYCTIYNDCCPRNEHAQHSVAFWLQPACLTPQL